MINRKCEYKGEVPIISHKELVDRAFLWLSVSNRHTVVFKERRTATSETPDAIGFKGSFSTIIECKASRADFLADKEKIFRQRPEQGMGYERYLMAPVGLLKPEEIPARWGLLEVYEKIHNHRAVREARTAEPFFERNLPEEVQYLVSAIHRIDISMAVFVKGELSGS